MAIGNSRIKWNNAMAEEFLIRAKQSLVAACHDMEKDIKKSFTSPAFTRSQGHAGGAIGRVYIRKGKRGSLSMHRASSGAGAGQPPAVDTGRLKASISTNWTGSGVDRAQVNLGKMTIKESGKKGKRHNVDVQSDVGIGNPGGSKELFKVVVGSNVRYAGMLEYGTRKMAKRPYLTPAWERIKPRIMNIIKNGSRGSISGGVRVERAYNSGWSDF